MISEDAIKNDIKNYWGNKNQDKIISNITILKNRNEICSNDAIAILTDWEEFKHINFNNLTLFDGRNFIKNENLNYVGL